RRAARQGGGQRAAEQDPCAPHPLPSGRPGADGYDLPFLPLPLPFFSVSTASSLTASAPPGMPLTRSDSFRSFLKVSAIFSRYSFSTRSFSALSGCFIRAAFLRSSRSRRAVFFSSGRSP